ncbi:MAG: hypothetical protein CMO40_08310 [Verrucomicrobiaceae bacterium]|nr:hypothetical protein [Verrucomicrobiaceae bacterium]
MLLVPRLRHVFLLSALAGVALLPGCASREPGSGEQVLFSKKIEFIPRYNIEQAVVTVFQMDGFQLMQGRRAGEPFQFLREGDLVSQQRFGDWFGVGVHVRAVVTVAEVEFGTHQVSCVLLSLEGEKFVPTGQGDGRVKALLKRVKKLSDVL